MDFSVRFSSIKNMLELCKKLTTGNVETYKGKGVKYQGEVIRRKAGKAGKK